MLFGWPFFHGANNTINPDIVRYSLRPPHEWSEKKVPWLCEVGNWYLRAYNHVQGWGRTFERHVPEFVTVKAGKHMAVEGLLYIEVAGSTVTRAAGPNIKRIIDQQVRLIDPDVVLKEKSFAGFMIKLEWLGIPKDIGKAQSLFSYLKRVLKDYFVAWRFQVNIKLIESED